MQLFTTYFHRKSVSVIAIIIDYGLYLRNNCCVPYIDNKPVIFSFIGTFKRSSPIISIKDVLWNIVSSEIKPELNIFWNYKRS